MHTVKAMARGVSLFGGLKVNGLTATVVSCGSWRYMQRGTVSKQGPPGGGDLRTVQRPGVRATFQATSPSMCLASAAPAFARQSGNEPARHGRISPLGLAELFDVRLALVASALQLCESPRATRSRGSAMPPIGVTPQTSPIAAEIYESLQPHLDALVDDERFAVAVGRLDAEALETSFRALHSGIVDYNKFHLQERRMWSAILRRGRPEGPRAAPIDKQEAEFKKRIPHARKSYLETFATADRMTASLGEAGFEDLLAEHLRPFMATLATPSHPFARVYFDHFRRAGCSEPMIEEFRTSFAKVNFDFFAVADGGLEEIRQLSKRGVEAQVEILDYTEERGFSYLRGRCGPPEWAILAANILAAAGISISAWVIVAIIVALLALLALICALSAPGTWVRTQCQRLNFLLPIFRF
jgi:hypothetical protein